MSENQKLGAVRQPVNFTETNAGQGGYTKPPTNGKPSREERHAIRMAQQDALMASLDN